MKRLIEDDDGLADTAFDLSALEKATLRARYEVLRADPAMRTYSIEEIAGDLGVAIKPPHNGHKAGTAGR